MGCDASLGMVECGIDLGTTYSLCVWVSRVAPGQLVFTFAEHASRSNPKLKQRLIPSVVSREARTGKLLVGLDAVENEPINPRETVRSIKRLMGRRFDDPEVVRLRKTARYQIDQDEAGMAVVVLGGRPYSPIEISAEILKRIKADAEETFGARVGHTVVSVPAHFANSQKLATREAARLAGLSVKRILAEPAAACRAVELDTKVNYALVWDMGGGTLDVTIYRVARPLPFYVAHDGDMWLGGDDVDTRLFALKACEIRKAAGLDAAADAVFGAALAKEVRRAKEVLCSSGRASEGLFPPPKVGGAPPAGPSGFAVSRAEVEEASRRDVALAVGKARGVLAKAVLPARAIGKVLLVGGSSGLPGVREKLAEIFPPDRIEQVEDPMSAVALGCGVLVREVQGVECKCGCVNDATALLCAGPACGAVLSGPPDVTPMPIGVEVQGGRFEVVVPASSRFGKSFQRVFLTAREGQTRLYVPVYEGVHDKVAQNSLEGFVVCVLPAPVAVDTPVTVTVIPDRDGVLAVALKCRDFAETTVLKHGDWSTSLRAEVEKYRAAVPPTQVRRADDVLAQWDRATPGSPEQAKAAQEGRTLLEQFRLLEWDRTCAVASFLEHAAGGAAGVDFVVVLEEDAQRAIKLALGRYHEHQADNSKWSKAEVAASLVAAIRALFCDDVGRTLVLVLLWGDKLSHNPDLEKLGKDRDELEQTLRADSPVGGPSEGRKFLTVVGARPYCERAWRETPGGSADTLKTFDNETRDPRGRD